MKKALILSFLFICPLGGIPDLQAAPTMDLYGTFQAMGIKVTVAPTDDPDLDATASVEYRTGNAPFRAGFPLSRIRDTLFLGSLFWLDPGINYEVRITFADPDGGPLNGVVVTALASTRPEITLPNPTHSYYISPTGSGTACSQAVPCALSYGLSQAQAGEAVVLRAGTYYQGEFILPRSGSAGAPMIIRSFPGEISILDGADPATFTWIDQGGGVYLTSVNAPDPHLVLAAGQRLFPYQNFSDLQNLVYGIPGFYASGTSVYVRLSGNADPNITAMTVSRYNHAFQVEQNFIYFLNLTFRHYGQGSYPKTIYFWNASDNLVLGCTFAHNDLGVGLKYDSHRNVIQDSVFYDSIFGWPWEAVKNAGTLEDGGVYIYNPLTGRGNVIRRNVFHDDFDAMHICPENEGINETDVYENTIYNMVDDGLETDGYCSNVRLWKNTFHNVRIGISLAPVFGGPVYALRNVIYRIGIGADIREGSAFKFNSGYNPPNSGPMFLFHNTADAVLANQNALTIFQPGAWKGIYARNNIWAGAAYALENYNAGQPIDLDYDNLWTSGSGDLVTWNNTHYATLAAFTAATGQETHGLNVNPVFADPAGGNYRLSPGSLLIDAGIIIPGINDQGPYAYTGMAPDLGAFEMPGVLVFLPLIIRN